MKQITINIYSFKELTSEAQNRAIKDHASFLASINWNGEEYKPDYVEKALATLSDLTTAIIEHGSEKIAVELQDYEFYEDGSRYHEEV